MYSPLDKLKDKLNDLGILVDDKTGHIRYHQNFLPVAYNFNLVFIRHGETYGNCGQSDANGQKDMRMIQSHIKNKNHRIFQGNVDSDINQLTKVGKIQALQAALKLENNMLRGSWKPDIIFYSILTRAKETGKPFVNRNNFQDRYVANTGIREICFGSWENRRICDMPPHDPCHLFYRDQNALVKSSGVDGNGNYQEAENFCELILRAYNVLLEIEKNFAEKNVVLFSHSMFGAACCILLGQGQTIEDGDYLAFDGKRPNGSSYVIPFATPLFLNRRIMRR